MALRKIRELGDPALTKQCREVSEMTPRLHELVDDMLETMYQAEGIGLAAPQVGILRKICVVDVTGDEPYVLINPELVESDGEETAEEGCLSVPGKYGMVARPTHIVAKAYDADFNQYEIEADDLLARAVCHEIEHLSGHTFVEKVEGGVNGLVDVDEQEALAKRIRNRRRPKRKKQ